MAELKVTLPDNRVAQFQDFARQKGQSPEQALRDLIDAVLPPDTGIASSPSVLDIIGFIKGSVKPIDWDHADDLIADEAMDTHEEQ